MISNMFYRKIILVVAGIWVLKRGRLFLESSLIMLTHKAFDYLGNRYRGLRFLRN